MKPYGIPRNLDVEAPDCADIHTYALKPSRGNIRGLGGDFHNSVRKSANKRNIRRQYKKLARRDGKSEIRNEMR